MGSTYPEDDPHAKPYAKPYSDSYVTYPPPPPHSQKTSSAKSTNSHDSGYGSGSALADLNRYLCPPVSGDSEVIADSGYAPIDVRHIAPVGSTTKGRRTCVLNKSGYLYCLHAGCEYQTKRKYDLDRHQKTHNLSPGSKEKFDCPGKGCGRTGKHAFDRLDHLREHLRKIHAKDIPQPARRRRDPPGDIGRNNAEKEATSKRKAQAEHYNNIILNGGVYYRGTKAPSELKEQGEDYNKIFPNGGVRFHLGSEAPNEPKGQIEDHNKMDPNGATFLLGNQNDLERPRSLSFQSLYVAEKGPATASGIERSVSHDMGVVDKETPSPTNLESVSDVQVAPEPKTTHGKSISQNVNAHNDLKPNKVERRTSTASANVERSTMMITGAHRDQDAVKPAKIISEPEKEARLSILHHSIHTTPLTVVDALDEPMSSLSDGEFEQPQFGIVGGDSCSNLKRVKYLGNVTIAEDGAKTYFSGDPIEPVEDISHHQKHLEHPEAIMDIRDTDMLRSSMSPEQKIGGHTQPVGFPEDMTKVKDAAQIYTSRNLVEAIDDQSPDRPHDAQANTKPLPMAPQYDAYVMTLLSLRIELRVWLGRRAPSPTIHISTSGETLLEDGKQRIRWTCRCGGRLYDDFEELRPGALEELEQALNEQNRVRSPEGNKSGQRRGSSIRALWNAAGGVISLFTSSQPFRNTNPPTLPLHQHRTAGQERKSQSSATPETLFLLMCIPYRKHGTRLVHMDLAELVSDETLFRRLRHEYQSIRGQLASYFSLWEMAEIQFVKFGLHKHQLIDIKERNDLPPATLKDEYRYQPVPAETIPPIGKNYLMHLYEHPDHANEKPFCLERIPKKLREQLKLAPHQAPGLLGWGVYFAEGFNWPKFWVFGSVVLSLSVLFGVCWSTLMQDIQGGFGVTACMMVAVTFTTGVVQAAVEQK